MLTTITIILAAGVLGGLTNFLTTKAEGEGWFHFWRCLVSGVAAAFVVPLFLKMIQSALLEQLPESATACFVFGGFCILAAFTSRSFLDSLARKALRLAQENSKKTEKIQTKVEEFDVVVEKETEESAPNDIDPATAKIEGNLAFGHKPLAVLKALINPKFTFRTIEGIQTESNLSRDEVQGSLRLLNQQGLVNQSTRRNGVRWYATARGRALLSAPKPASLVSEPPKCGGAARDRDGWCRTKP